MLTESNGPRGRAERDDSSPAAAMASSAQPRGSRIAQSSTVAPIVRPDGTVLVDVNGGRRITLDPFGSRVWALLADQPTLPVLMERLREDGTRSEQLAEDVTRLLARWREMNVIVWR